MTDHPDPALFTPHNISQTTNLKPSPLRALLRLLFVAIVLVAISGLFVTYRISSLNQPTASFPINQPITISEGMSVKDIAAALHEGEVVRSSTLLYYTIVLFHDPTTIKASTYIFDEPLTTYDIAKRLTEGDFDTDLIRLTHYEGERASQLAKQAANTLPNFSAESFIEIAEPHEGKLYPDTYLIPATYTEQDLLELLLATYEERLAPLAIHATSTGLSFAEVLILASIIEREANTPSSMQLVSSVLQNRLALGMALQADASIEYILDKPLAELTPDDLKIDSPYNTYLHTGLPPTPIGNPGLDAIMAVLEPTESDYFYYITDPEGEFHFAKTYNEHLQNIETYLR